MSKKDDDSKNNNEPISMLDWLKNLDEFLNNSGNKIVNGENPTFFIKSKREYKKWMSIGHEIYLRKTLLFHALTDLKKITKDFGDDIDNKTLLKLASTDVFVEKAQFKLQSRSKMLFWFGSITASLVICLFFTSIYYINDSSKTVVQTILDPLNKEVLSTYITYVIIKSTTIGAFFLGAIYFLSSLSRACFHESTVLVNKRHALRFGRLMLYLNNKKIVFKELNKAFKWNDEFTSAFKDIKPDRMTKTLWHKIIEVFPELLRELKGLRKNNPERTNNE